MINYFEKLREDEIKLMYRTPLLVSVLIAGADSKIDKKELKEVVSLTKLKQTKARSPEFGQRLTLRSDCLYPHPQYPSGR